MFFGIALVYMRAAKSPNMKNTVLCHTGKFLKILALVAILFINPGTSKAQYNTAIGLRAGWSSGLTVKQFIGNDAALDFLVSFWPRDLAVFCVYEKHKQLGNANGLNFYYGGGGHVAINTYRRVVYHDHPGPHHSHEWWYHDRDGFGIGVDVVAGLEFKFPDVPIALSLDIKPFIEFNTDRNIYWSPDPGLGIKVAF